MLSDTYRICSKVHVNDTITAIPTQPKLVHFVFWRVEGFEGDIYVRMRPENGVDLLQRHPFPDAVNHQLYSRYRERAKTIERLVICGRLGEYRYYDMDQAIGRALTLARRVLTDEHDPSR